MKIYGSYLDLDISSQISVIKPQTIQTVYYRRKISKKNQNYDIVTVMMAMMKIRPESREEIPVNVLSKHQDSC